MTLQEILAASLTKAEKARRLFDQGYTRRQVADLICGGNQGWAYNIYKKHFGLEGRARQIVEFNRKFGIEIEAFGVCKFNLADRLRNAGINVEVQDYNHVTCRIWKIVTDRSLEGRNTFELVSPILQGEAGLEELRKVCEVLERAGATINKTCGLHVHFEARQMNLSDWKNLYKNYITLEKEIDSIMPVSRRGNNNGYCKSLAYHCISKERAFELTDGATSIMDIASKLGHSERYYKINAHSFTQHGSVEFRQHSGTVDFKKISNWVRILNGLLDRSHRGLTGRLEEFLNDALKSYISERKTELAA